MYSIAVKGEEVYTGGQDCKIKKFNADDLSDVDSWQFDEEVHGRVRAIAFVGDNLAVGTYNNGMLFGKFGDEPEQIIFVSRNLANILISILVLLNLAKHEVVFQFTFYLCIGK